LSAATRHRHRTPSPYRTPILTAASGKEGELADNAKNLLKKGKFHCILKSTVHKAVGWFFNARDHVPGEGRGVDGGRLL